MSISESVSHFLNQYKAGEISEEEAAVRITHAVSAFTASKIDEIENYEAHKEGGISVFDIFSSEVLLPLALLIER